MEITSATEKYIPEIVELWKKFMDFHKDIDTRFPMSAGAQEQQEKHLMDSLESKDARLLVVLDNGHAVGYSLAEIHKYPPIFAREIYGYISDMFIQTEYRRKGIGGQMVAKIFEWFESRNIERIELSVAARNQVGYSFWRKQGFKDYAHRLYLDRG